MIITGKVTLTSQTTVRAYISRHAIIKKCYCFSISITYFGEKDKQKTKKNKNLFFLKD